jgi:hypothetical protein
MYGSRNLCVKERPPHPSVVDVNAILGDCVSEAVGSICFSQQTTLDQKPYLEERRRLPILGRGGDGGRVWRPGDFKAIWKRSSYLFADLSIQRRVGDTNLKTSECVS